jgi:hypothetical protein
MPCRISRSDFNLRIEQLKTNGRPHHGTLDSRTSVYHRLPSELFYEGKLIEGSVKIPNVRNPEQSVTLGIEGYDQIDALIHFTTEEDCDPIFLGRLWKSHPIHGTMAL